MKYRTVPAGVLVAMGPGMTGTGMPGTRRFPRAVVTFPDLRARDALLAVEQRRHRGERHPVHRNQEDKKNPGHHNATKGRYPCVRRCVKPAGSTVCATAL